MKYLLQTLLFSGLMSDTILASEGHSHGVAGELEHALPMIGVLLAILIIGFLMIKKSKKK